MAKLTLGVAVATAIGVLPVLHEARQQPQAPIPAVAPASASTPRTQVVMLGTGNPPADPDRSGPATAIVVNGTPYLVDFGAGVVRRAKSAVVDKGIAGLEPVNLRVAFVTHLHSDHTVGYPDLILTPWVIGRRVPLEVYGPTGIKAMTEHILDAYQRRLRDADEGPRALHGRRLSRGPRGERPRNPAPASSTRTPMSPSRPLPPSTRWRATAIASTRRIAAS